MRDRLSAIGTVALLLVGGGIWLLGEPKIGPDDSMHMLAPLMLMVAAVFSGDSWLLRSRETVAEASSPAFTLAVVAPLALVAASAFPSPLALAVAAVAWPLSVVPLAVYLVDQASPRGKAHASV